MLMKLYVSVRKLLILEEGATMVEYGLMVALIAVVCLAAVTLVGVPDGKRNRIGGQRNKLLRDFHDFLCFSLVNKAIPHSNLRSAIAQVGIKTRAAAPGATGEMISPNSHPST